MGLPIFFKTNRLRTSFCLTLIPLHSFLHCSCPRRILTDCLTKCALLTKPDMSILISYVIVPKPAGKVVIVSHICLCLPYYQLKVLLSINDYYLSILTIRLKGISIICSSYLYRSSCLFFTILCGASGYVEQIATPSP